jgi:hypothetical protein
VTGVGAVLASGPNFNATSQKPLTRNAQGDLVIDGGIYGTAGTFTGTVTAASFSGDGSLLTGVSSISGLSENYIPRSDAAGTGIVDSAIYDSGGNIGINTSSPRQALEINNAAVFSSETDNGNSGAAKTIDWNAGNKQKLTLTGACTLTFTAPGSVGNFQLRLIQDGTGGRTVVWPAAVKWPGAAAPTLTASAGAVDIVTFYYDGTNYYGMTAFDFR